MMRTRILVLLARQLLKNTFSNRAVVLLMVLVGSLLVYATITSTIAFKKQTQSRRFFQKEVRKHWEEMPDKHPHRMAHYGYIAFRARHPLTIFDAGTENYTGNAIFLEAHKQNSVNFSEAGFSSGLLRFGEISTANILLVLLPLVIFFIGFGVIASDRESGTLKLLISQGATLREMMFGNALGLMVLALGFLIPAFVLFVVAIYAAGAALVPDDWWRLASLLVTYTVYFAIICLVAVVVSATAKKAKAALLTLMGIWLMMAIVLPRMAQAVGTYMYRSPSRIAFETAIETDVLKYGDSHNPNDPYYSRLKDSLLKAHNVTSVEALPFNYGGFQMREGERLSAAVYNRHQHQLLNVYRRQNNFSQWLALVNPVAAARQLSMSFSAADFENYVRFQEQTEQYRFRLAQHMNNLQISLISNKKQQPGDKPYTISSQYWKAFPDFAFVGLHSAQTLLNHKLVVLALTGWLAGMVWLVFFLSKKLKPL